jgi:hypothetical protein
MAPLITLEQIFEKTLSHYKKHFGELVGLSAWILVAALPAAVSKIMEPFTAGTEVGPLNYIILVLKNTGGILLTVVSIWALIAIIIAISEQASGTRTSQREQGRRAWKLFFPYVWVSILLAVIMLIIVSAPVAGFILVLVDAAREQSTIFSSLGGFLLLVGGVISLFFLLKYSLQYGFAPYSLILEGTRGVKALKHSSSLVEGRWWATFIRFMVPKIIYSIVVLVANGLVFSGLAIFLLFTLGTGPLVQGIGNALWFLATIVVTVFLTPLVAVTDYHIYDSLRKTK